MGSFPASIYMLKVNNGATAAMREICSTLTKNTPELHQWGRCASFIVNFEQMPHIVLLFRLLTLNKLMLAGWTWFISILITEQNSFHLSKL